MSPARLTWRTWWGLRCAAMFCPVALDPDRLGIWLRCVDCGAVRGLIYAPVSQPTLDAEEARRCAAAPTPTTPSPARSGTAP